MFLFSPVAAICSITAPATVDIFYKRPQAPASQIDKKHSFQTFLQIGTKPAKFATETRFQCPKPMNGRAALIGLALPAAHFSN